MSARHTPGSWVADDFLEENGHSTRVAMPDRFGQPMATIAYVQQNWNDAACHERRISWAEAEANARLIAAAPDLLELVIQYRDDLKRPPSADSIERRLSAINAAIAKATS